SHHVHELNAEFTEPLPANEAHQIATSIHKWITTQSRMWADGPTVYEATFTTIQAARGRKSSESRRTDKRETVYDLINEGKLLALSTNILERVGVSANSQKKREYHPEVSSTGPLSHETPISAVQTNAVSRFASCAKRGYPCALSQPKSNAQ